MITLASSTWQNLYNEVSHNQVFSQDKQSQNVAVSRFEFAAV